MFRTCASRRSITIVVCIVALCLRCGMRCGLCAAFVAEGRGCCIVVVSSWFAMRVDILAITIMLLISMTCIYARNQEGADPVILSMLLSYVMTI